MALGTPLIRLGLALAKLPVADTVLAMSTLTKKQGTTKTVRKVVVRKPTSRRVAVQGSLAGTVTIASGFDPAAPAFPSAHWKHLGGK